MLNGYRIFVRNEEKVLGIISDDDYKTVNIFHATELYTYKRLK